MKEYLEELEDWLGYCELQDKPERVGPAMLARLKGKPKLIGRELPKLNLQSPGSDEAQPGYRQLMALLREKLV